MRTTGSEIATRYRDALLLTSVVALGTSGCWHEMPRDGREQFVENFLESIRDDTEFHRAYALARDTAVIEELRSRLSELFTIARWSGPLLEDECHVGLGDGSRLLLHVIQRQRSVQKVALYLYPSSAS